MKSDLARGATPHAGAPTYAIEGGEAGRERLRLVSRVLHDSTGAFLSRAGIAPGHAVLDAGCGGGDVTREIARRVGAAGRVVGVDADAVKLDIARAEAWREGLRQASCVQGDAHLAGARRDFDVVYARFLLSHLASPDDALHAFRDQLRPGGVVAIEDLLFDDALDARGDDWAVQRYRHLVHDCMRRAGGSPDVGLRLPRMLKAHGFTDIAAHIVQILALEGDAKRLAAVTIVAMHRSIVEYRLASAAEVDVLVGALEAFAARDDTLFGTPRIVQILARRPPA